jgi:hypothetical protein
MKIRTQEQLADRLSRDLAWRKKELSILFSLVRKNRNNHPTLELMLRSGATILYAHWEGFVRASATAYLQYVASRRLRYRDLVIPLRAVALEQKFNISSQSVHGERLIEIADFILNHQDRKCHISWKKAVHTHSNLKSTVFKGIVLRLGLDYSLYETKEKLIDRVLLHYRNNIAHGKGLYPAYEEYEQMHWEVISLMELYRNQIENAAFTEAYKALVSGT